jgi:hypothetical protein
MAEGNPMILRSCWVKGLPCSTAAIFASAAVVAVLRGGAPASKATKQMTMCSVTIGSSPYFFALDSALLE